MSSRRYFDAVASEWEGMRRGFFPEAVRDAALARAGVVAGRLAVDVGAGTGFVTEGLLARGVRVIAVDESPAMIDEMRARYGAQVRYRVGDGQSLPIEDGAADYAFANMYLHHAADPPVAIREMARILAPGGHMVITDLDAHEFAFLREEHCDRWLGFDHSAVLSWMRDAGLEDGAIEPAGSTCEASSESGAVEASVGIFLASGRKGGSATAGLA